MMLGIRRGYITIRYRSSAGLTYGATYMVTGVTDQTTYVEYDVVYISALNGGFAPADDGTSYWVTFDRADDDGWLGSDSRIKVFPTDFMSNDPSNPAYMTGYYRVTANGAATRLTAAISIPVGYKATHVRLYAASSVNVDCIDYNFNYGYASKGNGNTTAEIDIADVGYGDNLALLLQYQGVNGVECQGGYITIARI